MGRPKVVSDFELYEQDGIKVYCSKVVVSKNDELQLKLSSYLGIKHLSVGKIKV